MAAKNRCGHYYCVICDYNGRRGKGCLLEGVKEVVEVPVFGNTRCHQVHSKVRKPSTQKGKNLGPRIPINPRILRGQKKSSARGRRQRAPPSVKGGGEGRFREYVPKHKVSVSECVLSSALLCLKAAAAARFHTLFLSLSSYLSLVRRAHAEQTHRERQQQRAI